MIEPDEQMCIDGLRDPSVSPNDKSGYLDVLEVLLPDRDVLPVLTALIDDAAQPPALRKQAERLALSIDPDFVSNAHI